MDAKWPIILMTIFLFVIMGTVIASMDRNVIMSNWADNRCNLSVMFTSFLFKPDSDTRSRGEFSTDNFSFCMQSFVQQFMAIIMTPINAIFSKQIGITDAVVDTLNSIQKILSTMYNAFTSYLGSFFGKFNSSVYEMSRIIQYLHMAVSRANAMAVSMIYTGLSVFQGMINTIQTVIKVILIICAIMLVIIIILFLFFFEFIPLIIAALIAVVSAVSLLSFVMPDSVRNDAESNKSNWTCFAAGTQMGRKGEQKTTSVEDIKVGDELSDGSRVTAVIQSNGSQIKLYDLLGIRVSGSHLVKQPNGQWKSVSSDKRAVQLNEVSPILYCFNTTSNCIPIQSPTTHTTFLFRDWEEIGNDDHKGQYTWNYMVSNMLNRGCEKRAWKHNLKVDCEVALVGKQVRVKTIHGWVPISSLATPFGKVMDRMGKEQDILGIVHGEVEGAYDEKETWHTEHYEEHDGIWIKGTSTVHQGTHHLQGMALITESGEYIVWDPSEQKEKLVRDFTEVGYHSIHETYSFVEARLRTFCPNDKTCCPVFNGAQTTE
jgi:hypothetical protein